MTTVFQNRGRLAVVLVAMALGVALFAIAYALFMNTATSENTITADGQHDIQIRAGDDDSENEDVGYGPAANGALSGGIGSEHIGNTLFFGAIDVRNFNDSEPFEFSLTNDVDGNDLSDAIEVTLSTRTELFGVPGAFVCNGDPSGTNQTLLGTVDFEDEVWIASGDLDPLAADDVIRVCVYLELDDGVDVGDIAGEDVTYDLTFTATDPS